MYENRLNAHSSRSRYDARGVAEEIFERSVHLAADRKAHPQHAVNALKFGRALGHRDVEVLDAINEIRSARPLAA